MRYVVLVGLLLFQFQAAPQRPKTDPKQQQKKIPKDAYDPNHLSPGEIACGRERSDVPGACKCMKYRVEASAKAQLECELISDKQERIKCMLINEACNLTPIDVDHAGWDEGRRMPSQCKRSCSKARCECCKS